MRALAIVLLVGGCYAPSLPDAPFTCGDGVCPDGYRCEQGLCLAPSEPAPPVFIATTSADSAPPQAVFDGSLFGVFWHQAPGGPTDGPASGIHLSTVGSDGRIAENLVYSIPNDLTFRALYHPMAQRHVVVLATNNINESRLTTLTFEPNDPTMADSMNTEMKMASALGYTTPSIALADGSSIRIAYTFASPPTIDSDNVFCEAFDVLSGDVSADVCKPSPANTNGQFVVEATVAVTPAETTLFWRTTDVWESVFSGATEQKPMKLNGLNRVVRAVYSGSSLGIVGEKPSDGTGPRWAIGPG